MDSTTMTLLVALLLVVGSTTAALNHDGAKCGEKHCSTIEYCSSYDKSCKPCSSICNKTARNYLPQECFSDCQGEQQGDNFSLLETRSNRYKRFGIDRGKGQVTARSLAPEYIYERVRVRWLYTWPPSLRRLPHTRPTMMTHPTCLPAYLLSFLSSFLLPLLFLFSARQPASHPRFSPHRESNRPFWKRPVRSHSKIRTFAAAENFLLRPHPSFFFFSFGFQSISTTSDTFF